MADAKMYMAFTCIIAPWVSLLPALVWSHHVLSHVFLVLCVTRLTSGSAIWNPSPPVDSLLIVMIV